MFRIIVLAFTLATTPALAFDLEKWADGLANRQMEKWKKEIVEATEPVAPRPDWGLWTDSYNNLIQVFRY